MSSSPTSSSSTEPVHSRARAPRGSIDDLVLRFGPVPLAVTYEIGTTFMRIRDLLELAEGSLVVLQRLAGEDLEVRVNGEFLGMGEVTESDGKAAIRMSGRVDEV